ncbi:calcium-activated potassium channel subunit beta-3 isoform X2 [Erinaceus europaeus]|uniref:Calcium-activated potassium channel subunit beta n=1 Tax=Erinaceus europaeus TaxID=9365 RepID=A0A1S3W537_ERIEU|nr:calcium-activated potassium channel subunit beta-3 isoform X2 [Erinaceus europaeus]
MQPFSIPVQITLQGSRRCHGRAALSPSERKRDTEQHAGGSQDVHTKLPSSAGEDRAMLLGFAMMGFSVLMFFLFGKPFMLSTQREESNCTMVQTHVLEEQVQCAFTCGADCRAQGTDLCLQVFVNLTHSGQKVLLYYNEEAIQINSKCFYTPTCLQDRNDLLSSALDIKKFFDHKNGTPFPCFYSPGRPEDVVLIKKSDLMVTFHCLFWPSLTLLGGALIVGMVRLTQYLSHLCEKYSSEVGSRVPHIEHHQLRQRNGEKNNGRS